MLQFFVILIVGLSVLGTGVVFTKFFPAKPLPDDVEIEELTRKYKWWDLLILLPFFIATAVATLVLWVFFYGIAYLYKTIFLSGEIVLTESIAYWFLVAFFPGIVLGGIAVSLVIKRWKPEQYAEYELYAAARQSYDVKIAATALCFVVFGGALAGAILGFDNYFLIRQNEIVINRYFSFGFVRYSYSEITHIQTSPYLTAPNGNITKRRLYLLRFEDGKKWSTDGLAEDLSAREQRQLFELISERSEVPLQEIDRFQQSDLYKFYW